MGLIYLITVVCSLDEEMIENLFGMSSRATASSVKRFASSAAASQKNEILDPRKAHNIAIQLRARGLSRVEVCDALVEGEFPVHFLFVVWSLRGFKAHKFRRHERNLCCIPFSILAMAIEE